MNGYEARRAAKADWSDERAVERREPRQHAEVAAIVEGGKRGDVIKAIRSALRRRSGKAWSVTGGRGTAYGWIKIRPFAGGSVDELAKLLGLEYVHHQGYDVPSSYAYRRVALARAMYGEALGFTAEPYWD